MKANTYRLLEKCIEDGLAIGWNRAHKHTDEPSQDMIFEALNNAIMGEIGEWFWFEDLYADPCNHCKDPQTDY